MDPGKLKKERRKVKWWNKLFKGDGRSKIQREMRRILKPKTTKRKIVFDLSIYNNPSYLLNFEESSSFQFYLQPLPKPSVTKPFSFHRSDIPACGILVARITIPG